MNAIREFLLRKNIKVTSKGFFYLECAIEMCLKDRTYLQAIHKRLYFDIAKKFNDKPSRVERAMRFACDGNYKVSEILALANITLGG